MAIANENYDVGGTGGALFASNPAQQGAPAGGKRPGGGGAPAQAAGGDDYKPPPGIPGWKAPSFDDDDRIDPDKYPEPASGKQKTGSTRI